MNAASSPDRVLQGCWGTKGLVLLTDRLTLSPTDKLCSGNGVPPTAVFRERNILNLPGEASNKHITGLQKDKAAITKAT